MQRAAAGGGPDMFYYHYDGLGSVIALSDINGTIIERYEYDVYGEPTIWDMSNPADPTIVSSSIVGNPYMFTGRRFDSETGLYYYRMRYYSPELGRFLQTDPIGYYYSMNLYEYCWNNPIIFLDPYGLGIWTWIGVVAEATGGALLGYAAASTAPVWVVPAGVGLVFFGIGNQIGDYIFDKPLHKLPGRKHVNRYKQRLRKEIYNYPVYPPYDSKEREKCP